MTFGDNKLPFDLFGIECGEGWAKLYTPIIEYANKNHITIMQVKEKFGSLRVYCEYNQHLEQMILEAEKLSSITCEYCGEPGKLRNNRGWYKTLCNKCNSIR